MTACSRNTSRWARSRHRAVARAGLDLDGRLALAVDWLSRAPNATREGRFLLHAGEPRGFDGDERFTSRRKEASP